MKKFKYLGAAMLLALVACKTNAVSSVTWKADGKIANNAGQQKQLSITGVYDSLDYEGITFLAGFKIAKDGTNYPQLVSADESLTNIKYWDMEKIPSDIFVYQKAVHMADMDGSVYKLEKGQWQLAATTFPPESQVVYSDNNTDIILCYPASPLKNVMRESGCKSLENKWKLDFVWITQQPKLCGNQLFVLEELESSSVLKKVDIKTGKVVFSEEIRKHADDICSL